jgi:hypothetical protein
VVQELAVYSLNGITHTRKVSMSGIKIKLISNRHAILLTCTQNTILKASVQIMAETATSPQSYQWHEVTVLYTRFNHNVCHCWLCAEIKFNNTYLFKEQWTVTTSSAQENTSLHHYHCKEIFLYLQFLFTLRKHYRDVQNIYVFCDTTVHFQFGSFLNSHIIYFRLLVSTVFTIHKISK